MGINYFTLKEGVLELHVDKLIIFDNAKRERVSQLLYLLGLLVYSSGSFFRGLKDGEPSIIFIGIILLLIFVSYVFKRKSELKAVENEIYLRDISQVFFEGGIQDTQVVTILTRKNRTRKVIMENDNNLPGIFMNNLRNMHIKVSDK